MKFIILILLFSLRAHAGEAGEYFERLDRMVNAGAIMPEGASQERLHLRSTTNKQAQRGEAQRALASVNPALHPLQIKRFKAEPMELELD